MAIGVSEFLRKDEEFAAWRVENPRGYVLAPPGRRRAADPTAYLLHQSVCSALNADNTDQRKWCGARAALIEWVQDNGEHWDWCRSCHDDDGNERSRGAKGRSRASRGEPRDRSGALTGAEVDETGRWMPRKV